MPGVRADYPKNNLFATLHTKARNSNHSNLKLPKKLLCIYAAANKPQTLHFVTERITAYNLTLYFTQMPVLPAFFL
jgi:hypothetical protein